MYTPEMTMLVDEIALTQPAASRPVELATPWLRYWKYGHRASRSSIKPTIMAGAAGTLDRHEILRILRSNAAVVDMRCVGESVGCYPGDLDLVS